MQRKAHVFMVKPTDFCNLDCTYCYSPNRRLRNVIADEALDALIVRMVEDFPDDHRFQVVWHGSEPMGVGVDFYRDAIARIRGRLGDRVQFHMQSNLTLLHDGWLDLLVDEGFSISTSIDGPRAVHDRKRVTLAGGGTFDKVARNIQRLRGRGLPVAAVLVLSRETLGLGAEIYALLRELGLHVRVNPVLLPEGTPGCLPPAAFGEFVRDLAERWLADGDSTFYIEPLRGYVLRLVGGAPLMCEQQALCFEHMIGVGTDGGLYPCNRFVGGDDLRLGNIRDTSIRSLPLHPVAQRTARRHLDSAKCRSCHLVDVCQGGCMYHAHAIYGDAFREDYFCESYVILYDFVIRNLGALLRRLEGIPRNRDLDELVAALETTAA
ncbi:MAG: radical SAM protein [Nannocystaceae bacterium]